MPKITVTFPKDPLKPTKIETEGFSGSGCKAVTEGIENALGSKISDVDKPEMHEQSVDNTINQGLG
jgi:hypothetical protein